MGFAMSFNYVKAAVCAATMTCAAVTGAQAHIVLDTREAVAGSYFKSALRVGHGCSGSGTVSITVTLPMGTMYVRPQLKPGWRIEIEREPLAEPVKGYHGKVITDRVARITWTGGPLPDAYFDEFGIQMKLPASAPGDVLHFPVLQKCEQGARDWAEIPPMGKTSHDVTSPAPALRLLPKP